MLNSKQLEILTLVETLLKEGKSFAIEELVIEPDNSIFKSRDGKRCVQYIRLPSGERVCVKYE